MAELIKIKNNREGFLEIIDLVLTKGVTAESRNGVTKEIRDLVIELADPHDALPNGVRPGLNPAIGMVEALQLVGGFSDATLTCEIQPNFKSFLDDGTLYGAYGPRTVDQFPMIFDRLQKDPDTRQAIITLWDPEKDAPGGRKDHPCTTAFSFLIRDDKLHMSTFMRSNDLWWGWPYDAFQFTTVQATMAHQLGVGLGTYTHHAASFHLYAPHWKAASDAYTVHDPGTCLQTKALGGSRPGWLGARAEAREIWEILTSRQDPDMRELSAPGAWYAQTLAARRAAVTKMTSEKLNAV